MTEKTLEERVEQLELDTAMEHAETYEIIHLMAQKLLKLREDVNTLKRRQDQTVCYLKQRYEADKEAAIDRDIEDTMAKVKSGEIKTKPYEPRDDAL